jgi:hypothetical protein
MGHGVVVYVAKARIDAAVRLGLNQPRAAAQAGSRRPVRDAVAPPRRSAGRWGRAGLPRGAATIVRAVRTPGLRPGAAAWRGSLRGEAGDGEMDQVRCLRNLRLDATINRSISEENREVDFPYLDHDMCNSAFRWGLQT